MDPVSAAEVLVKVYQAAGLLGLMMIGFALLIYAGYKDNKAREKNLVKTIAECHDKHDESGRDAVAAIVRSTAAIENNTQAMHRFSSIVDTEFKRRDLTPPNGHHTQH